MRKELLSGLLLMQQVARLWPPRDVSPESVMVVATSPSSAAAAVCVLRLALCTALTLLLVLSVWCIGVVLPVNLKVSLN